MNKTFHLIILFCCALMSGVTFGQTNLIPKPGFTSDYTSADYHGDYTFVPSSNNCLGGDGGSGKLLTGSQAHTYNNNFFNCSGHGGSGRFLIVNGKGGTGTMMQGNPSNWKILKYNINNIQPNSFYDFSFWATHLSPGESSWLPGYTIRAIFRVTFNGQNLPNTWSPTYTGDSHWDQFPVYHWYSGNSTSLEICIYDDCRWTSNYGDDFGIDDLSLYFDRSYVSTAVNKTLHVCAETENIIYFSDVMAGDNVCPHVGTITPTLTNPPHNDAFFDAYYEGGQVVGWKYKPRSGVTSDNFSYQYTYPINYHGYTGNYISNTATVNIVVDPLKERQGIVNGTDCGSYTYTNYQGEQFMFSESGLYDIQFPAPSGCDSIVHLNVTITEGPTVDPISDMNPVCAGSTLTPPAAPHVNWTGVTGTGQWQYCASATGTFQPWTASTVFPYSADGYWFRYLADDGFCNPVPSNVVHIDVYDKPYIVPISSPDTICAGDSFDLPNPDVSGIDWFGNVGEWHWEIASTSNGTYSNLNNSNIPLNYNGRYIRLKAKNSCCGSTEWIYSNAVQVWVHDAPTLSTISAPAAICSGESFNLPTMTPNWNNEVGNSFGWEVSETPNGSYTSFSNISVGYEYNGYYLRYYAENGCGRTTTNNVVLRVYQPLEIGELTAPAPICAGESLTITQPNVLTDSEPNVGFSLEIADNPDGPFVPFTNQDVPYSYNGYYIRYVAQNACGSDTTMAVQITVYSTEDEYVNLMSCDDYVTWINGVQYQGSEAGMDYNVTYPNANGCDVTYHLHVVKGDAIRPQPDVQTECFYYDWHGHRYDEVGTHTYEDVVQGTASTNYCDSIYTLILTINKEPEFLEDIIEPEPVCENGNIAINAPDFTWNHVDGGTAEWRIAPTANGDYQSFSLNNVSYDYNGWWLRYVATNDCASSESNAVQIHVNQKPTVVTQIHDFVVCAGQTLDLPDMQVNWHGSQIGAGWYLQAPDGNVISIDENTPIQSSYDEWLIYYAASNECGEGRSEENLIFVNDKPSVSDFSVQGVCAGEPFDLPDLNAITNWHGDNGTARWEIATTPAGPFETWTPMAALYDMNGCYIRCHATNGCGEDTMHMARLEVFTTEPIFESLQACNPMEVYGYGWCDHDDVYYRDSITENGCVRPCTLTFSIGTQAEPPTIYVQECGEYYWEQFDKLFTETQYFDTLIVSGDPLKCDTLYSINVEISHPNPLVTTTESTCHEFFWDVNGRLYEESVVDTFYRPNGYCTDTLVLRLTIEPMHWDSTVVSCQSLFWNEALMEVLPGNEYDTIIFDHATGCDMNYHLLVEWGDDVNEPVEDTTSCAPVEWHGQICDVDGEYYRDTILDPETGCAHISTLHLTLTGYTDFQINGENNVAASTHFWPGKYTYYVDESITEEIHWNLEGIDWPYQSDATGNSCWVIVSHTGQGQLIATVGDGGCNRDTIFINATQFDVNEYDPQTINIFPNPAQYEVTIDANEIQNVRVYNMMGQLVRDYQGQDSDRLTFSVRDLSPALYVVEVRTEQGVQRKTLTVSR